MVLMDRWWPVGGLGADGICMHREHSSSARRMQLVDVIGHHRYRRRTNEERLVLCIYHQRY